MGLLYVFFEILLGSRLEVAIGLSALEFLLLVFLFVSGEVAAIGRFVRATRSTTF